LGARIHIAAPLKKPVNWRRVARGGRCLGVRTTAGGGDRRPFLDAAAVVPRGAHWSRKKLRCRKGYRARARPRLAKGAAARGVTKGGESRGGLLLVLEALRLDQGLAHPLVGPHCAYVGVAGQRIANPVAADRVLSRIEPRDVLGRPLSLARPCAGEDSAVLALVAVLAADPDWTKLVKSMPLDRTEAEIIVAAMRELLCGENGELQNLTEDGHIRLCVLAVTLHLQLPWSMLDVDAFVRIIEKDFTGKPDARAGEETGAHRGWWFKRPPFDKATHGQLLAAIGTKAEKRKNKKKKSGSKRK